MQCEPLECVRIGFVGLGVRAKRAVHRMMHIEGCRITALCDLVLENIDEAKAIITEDNGGSPATYCDSEGWKALCRQPRTPVAASLRAVSHLGCEHVCL